MLILQRTGTCLSKCLGILSLQWDGNGTPQKRNALAYGITPQTSKNDPTDASEAILLLWVVR